MSKESLRLAFKQDDASLHGESFLDRFTLYQLSVTSSLADRLLTEMLKKDLNLSLAEWRIMLIVGKIPGLSTDDLAGKTTMDKAKVSRAIARLSDIGLINRKILGSDRRVNSLSITKVGSRIFAKCVHVAEDAQRQILSDLNETEKLALFSLLAKVHNAQKKHKRTRLKPY